MTLETERMPSSFYSSSFTFMATALNSSLLPSSGSLDQKHFLYLLTFITHKKKSAPPVSTPIGLCQSRAFIICDVTDVVEL